MSRRVLTAESSLLVTKCELITYADSRFLAPPVPGYIRIMVWLKATDRSLRTVVTP